MNTHFASSAKATAVDLFAGAGGLSEGARMAGIKVKWAANHWDLAVETHKRNHADTEHSCQDLQQANFYEVPNHDFLLAAPACQGHSHARGKDRPHHDAQRATAWAVVTCAEVHRPKVVLCENVKAFSNWVLYKSWCASMDALGYALAPMLVDAADHGVPQHRERLIIVATRSKHPIELRLPKREHVPVASIIDFEAGSWSKVERKGRTAKTLARVANGRKAFGERFVMPYYGSGSGLTGRSIHRPIGTITTKARWAVVDGDRMRMLSTNEARAVMSFRPDYILPSSATQAMHLLGNAVCPVVAADILTAILEAA